MVFAVLLLTFSYKRLGHRASKQPPTRVSGVRKKRDPSDEVLKMTRPGCSVELLCFTAVQKGSNSLVLTSNDLSFQMIIVC